MTYFPETASQDLQTVNTAENQFSKDVDILMALLDGTSPGQMVFHPLAWNPDSSIAYLRAIFCTDCLQNDVVSQEDLNYMSLLQTSRIRPHQMDKNIF